jgi:hypothetical protein
MEARDQAIIENWNAFDNLLPGLLRTHLGKLALMRYEKLVRCFDSMTDGLEYARARYPDDHYSLHPVVSLAGDPNIAVTAAGARCNSASPRHRERRIAGTAAVARVTLTTRRSSAPSAAARSVR